MRLMKGRSKNPTYHVIKDVRRDGKRSTVIVENLGHADEICSKYNVSDPDAWAEKRQRMAERFPGGLLVFDFISKKGMTGGNAQIRICTLFK